LFLVGVSCSNQTSQKEQVQSDAGYRDIPFIQETHDGFIIGENAADNEVRSIAVDKESTVWIAAASGVFKKAEGSRNWESVITGEDQGPAYSVLIQGNGSILMGTWNGVYGFSEGKLTKYTDVKPPISVLCSAGEETYALGPHGIWLQKTDSWEEQPYKIARSVRDASTDGKGNLWVATDAGLYLCRDGKSTLYQNTTEMITAYARAIGFSTSGDCWVGNMGGVSVRTNEKLIKKITPQEGLSSIFVNCITPSADGKMWVGTDVGVVRFDKEYNPSLLFSRRWLMDDKVNDIAFDKVGNAWIATDGGVSCIKQNQMSLADKEKNLYGQLMYRHIREPWTCSSVRLEVAGDTASWKPEDDDNDGEYTGGYLAMESFRYAVTKSEDAHQKARKAFEFLRQLQTVTGTQGFFARSIVPPTWTKVHDANRKYTERERAEELVKDPRYKPVEERWRLSADGKWLWKGDTSSDEMDGHYMAYFYFYEFAANDEEKQMVRDHVKKLTDELILNNFNLIDIDETHSRWGVWSPEQLKGDPDWSSEKSLNCFELLAYLKLAYGITGDETYQKEYLRLITDEGYLELAKGINSKNPAWQIYFDLTMEGYLFPILFKYEKDPQIMTVYEDMLEKWIAHQKEGENLINNMAYTLCTGKQINVEQTISFLKDTPLDLIDWTFDHTKRDDVKVVRTPIMEEVQIDKLPPASIRATVRWDKNPWSAVNGNPNSMREPVFWLWPYWEARYLGIINE
jgi:streptogramin lyase